MLSLALEYKIKGLIKSILEDKYYSRWILRPYENYCANIKYIQLLTFNVNTAEPVCTT